MNTSCKKYFLLFFTLCFVSIGFSQTRDLEYFIDQGLKNSPLLNDLLNKMRATTLDSLIINAERKPQIEARSELLYAPYNNKFGYDEIITDGGNYQAVGYVSQKIFAGKNLQNKYQAINNTRFTLGIDKKISEAELKKTITGLYLDSYSVYSDLAFNRAFLDLMSQQDKIIHDFVKAAIYSQTDYLAALVETREQEIIVEKLKNLYLKDIRLLNEICGLRDTSYVELSEPGIKLLNEGDPGDNLFLKQFIADSLMLVNEKDALKLRYIPSINWFADAGILTSNPWNFYRHFGFSAGISLTVPIFDGRQRILEEKKLRIREDTRSAYSANNKKQYDQKYLSLKGELEGIKEIRIRLDEQVLIAQELVTTLRLQVENGLARISDYLPALKNYRSIRHNLNMTEIELLRIISEMNYLLSE